MSHISRDSHRYPTGSPSRYYDRRDERDGRMYDDRSHSRSRSADRMRRSPGYEDYARAPPNRSAGDGSRDYSGNREPGVRYGSKDSDERWRRSSRSPPPRRGRPAYRDRDREGYRSPPYGSRNGSYSRSRSRSPRRGRQAYHGHESKEVMLDGLPINMVEEDVRLLPPFLQSYYNSALRISKQLHENYHVEGLEDVRVIRDRQTKISRQIAFLTFRSLGDSRAFVERNFPSMYLVGPGAARDDRGSKVRIAYSRDREDRNRGKGDGDWTCGNCAIMNYGTRHRCFRCQAPRPDPTVVPPLEEPAPRVLNNGDNDTAPDSQPSQFLLFRGLDSSVSEELFGKGVAKLYRPATSGGESQSSNQKKGAKVASTTGDANLGAREGSIRRVLLVRDRSSNESWGYGFAEFATVQDAQAAIARLHSFEKFTISSKPVLVTYIHAGVFVPVMNPSASTDRFTFSPLANPALKLMYWDEEAYVTELVISTKDLDSHPKPERGTAIQSDSQTKSGKDVDKAKKRKAEAINGAATGTGTKKLAVPSQLQFWSNRHAELHGIQKKDGDEQALGDVPSGMGSEANDSPADLTAPPTQTYADLNRNCCYLCMRQFESAAEVNRHERLSQLHRDNLQKDDLRTKAMTKLIKHGIVSQSTSEYRDRAKERRQAFGNAKSVKAKPAPASVKEEVETAVQAPSKGASLLGKMGWSAGSGLGAQGTGVTAPIATEVYAQGVGLGAQGSKLGDATEEANRNTRGRYDEFLEKTKQMARERYEQMS